MFYILYGNDSFERKRYTQKLTAENPDFQVVSIDCEIKKFSYQSIIKEYSMLDLFSSPKIIVADDFPDFKKNRKTDDRETEDFEKLLNDSFDNPNIIVFSCDYNVYKQKKLFKLFKQKNSTILQFNSPDDKDFAAYARTRLRNENVRINENAFRILTERIKNDKFTLENEIRKFKAYDDIIDVNVVEKLVSRSYDDNTFHLINAVIGRDTRTAVKTLNDLYALNVDPNMMVSLLASQYRFLFQVRSLADKGYGNDRIAQEMGLNKSGRVYYAMKGLGRVTTTYLLHCLHDLAELEHRFKTVNGINRNLELELFILNRL